jgi:hypothetical protein
VEGFVFWTITGMENVPIHLDYKGRKLTGVADPIDRNDKQGVPTSYIIYIHGKFIGTLHCETQGWVMDRPTDADLVESLGEYLHAWYE